MISTFSLVNGKVKFAKYELVYQDKKVIIRSEDHKAKLVEELERKNIDYFLKELEQPSEELLQRCEGRLFNNTQEAQEFISSGVEPVTLDTLIEVVADFIGGAL